MQQSSHTQSKGKERASQDSPFEPEQPRRGPQLAGNTRSSTQDEAKRRLQRTKSPQQPPQQNKEDDDDNSKGKASSQASTPTVTGDGNVSPPSNARRESSREASSATMQAMGSNSGSVMGYSQQQQILLHRPQRLRIREDLTKSTSFDRARDGDELYSLWVGPP